MIGRDMIGQVVGDYRIVEVLGEGGMGVVFKGLHERLGQTVAVKMLHPELVSEEKTRSRFVREAQALARLNHPNVVRLLNFLNLGEQCFIVMEYIEGRTIDAIMEEKGLLPAARAADYMVQALAAMDYAHSLGIIHRDIKPANIAVLESGQVKVLDFGTAKIIGAQKLTQEGMTLGTLIYMSPEQVCGRDLDHRSDIYSLGVTLYEMVTGHLPHYCDDEMTLVREIARGVPDPPSKHYPYIPKTFEAIILRAIEKDPARRFQTVNELLKDLNAFLAEERRRSKQATPAAHPQRPIDEAAEHAEAEAETSGLQLAGTAGALILAGLGVILLVAAPHPAIGATALALAVVLAVFVVAYVRMGGAALRGRAPRAVDRPMPESVVGESTLNLEEGPAAISASPPPPPPPAPEAPAAAGQPMYPGAGPAHGAAQGELTAYLYAFQGPDQGGSWPLPQGAITIGRGPHNVIVLNDHGVSTTHAQIGFDGGRFLLTDLQSRNGSYLNNERVTAAPLQDQDVIVLGNTHLAVSITSRQPA